MGNTLITRTPGAIYIKDGGAIILETGGVIDATLGTIDVGPIVIGNDAIATANIQDAAVTKEKTAMFISANLTGTGAPQIVAHGLGVDPTAANLTFSIVSTAAAGNFAFTAVATDATNITVTATATIVFRVVAWAP